MSVPAAVSYRRAISVWFFFLCDRIFVLFIVSLTSPKLFLPVSGNSSIQMKQRGEIYRKGARRDR